MTDTDRQIEDIRSKGYAVIEDALVGAQLASLRAVYDRLMSVAIDLTAKTSPGSRHIEVKRILEQDPVVADLMDHPVIFPLAKALIGPDITLASGGEGDYRPALTGAYISWHRDFEWMVGVPFPRQNHWIRCTYFIDDVGKDMGPFTLLPGSHLRPGPDPKTLTGPDRQPRNIPGEVAITGPAGTCLINNTEILHTSTPNRSQRPRKTIMLLYKHAWMRQWEDGYDLTPAFAAAQTDPRRQQLCNVGIWHRSDGRWLA